jgi:hypothetical protein
MQRETTTARSELTCGAAAGGPVAVGWNRRVGKRPGTCVLRIGEGVLVDDD